MKERRGLLLLAGGAVSYVLALLLGYGLVRLLPGFSAEIALISGAITMALSLPVFALVLHRHNRLLSSAQHDPRPALSRSVVVGQAACSVLLLASLYGGTYLHQVGHFAPAVLLLSFAAGLSGVLIALVRRARFRKGAA